MNQDRDNSENAVPKPQTLELDRQYSIPMPKWRPPHSATGMSDADRARWCLDHGAGRLSREERAFLFSVSRFSGPLMIKQRQRLADLHARLSKRT